MFVTLHLHMHGGHTDTHTLATYNTLAYMHTCTRAALIINDVPK